MLAFAVVHNAYASLIGIAPFEVPVSFQESDCLLHLRDVAPDEPFCHLPGLEWFDLASKATALRAHQFASVQIERIGAAEDRPVTIDGTEAVLIEPAGFVLFIQPPLQGVKAAISIPFAYIRRADNIKPLEIRGRQNAPDLKRKDDHAVILAAATFPAA